MLTDRIRFALSQRQLFGSDGCAYVVVPYIPWKSQELEKYPNLRRSADVRDYCKLQKRGWKMRIFESQSSGPRMLGS